MIVESAQLRTSSPLVNRLIIRLVLALVGCVAWVVITGCEGVGGSGGPAEATTGTQALRVIEGTAYLADADPVTSHAGILVYLAGTGHEARTDRNGQYRISGVPTGAYEIIAEKAGFRSETFDTLAVDAAANGAVPLRPKIPVLQPVKSNAVATGPDGGASQLGGITGVVYLEGAGDYSGTRVQVDGTAIVTVTDEDGRYRLLNMTPGTYRLLFSRNGFVSGNVSGIVVRAGETAQVPEQALERAVPRAVDRRAEQAARSAEPTPLLTATGGDRVISGIVSITGPDGAPATDYSNVLVAINDTDLIATPDSQGRFEFVNLAPNLYTLLTTLDGGPAVRTPADVRNQQTATVKISLSLVPEQSGTGTVTGQFVLLDTNGELVADASGIRVGLAGTQSTAVTAANGVFELKDVPVGTYTLTAAKENYEDFSLEGVEVVAGQTTDLGELAMVLDVEYPRVIGTIPASGTTNVPVGLDIVLQIRFSKKMNAATVRNAVTISPPVEAQVLMGKGAHPLADDDSLVIVLSNLDDQLPIRFSTTYRVTIAETATDFEGIAMQDAYSMTFTTGAPGLIATQPPNGARNVYLDQNAVPVILNFNTRLDPETLNSRNIRVRPDNGISVHVTWLNDPQTGWTNVRVATQWQQDTQYTITIGRDVRAYNGQPLGNTPYTLRFRTGILQVLQAPVQVIR